jgi:hypothetical protein
MSVDAIYLTVMTCLFIGGYTISRMVQGEPVLIRASLLLGTVVAINYVVV